MPPQHLSRSVRRDLRQASERARRVRRSERFRSLRRQDVDTIRLKRAGRCSEKRGRRELVVSHLQLADTIAHRYAGRRQDADDLRQVAYLGLVKAAERFDPERSDDFASFAVPTIAGEIKRHFRDNCWFVRPPRSLQELKSTVEHEVPRMAQQLGRDPSRGEIAERVGEPAERIDEAIGCSRAMHPMSLDAPVSTADEHTAFGDTWTTFSDKGGDTGYATQIGDDVLLVYGSADKADFTTFMQALTQAELPSASATPGS